jgi:hypothetical protein
VKRKTAQRFMRRQNISIAPNLEAVCWLKLKPARLGVDQPASSLTSLHYSGEDVCNPAVLTSRFDPSSVFLQTTFAIHIATQRVNF